jgi:hypothetical protein
MEPAVNELIMKVFCPAHIYKKHKSLFEKARIAEGFWGVLFGVATNWKINLATHRDRKDYKYCGTVPGG